MRNLSMSFGALTGIFLLLFCAACDDSPKSEFDRKQTMTDSSNQSHDGSARKSFHPFTQKQDLMKNTADKNQESAHNHQKTDKKKTQKPQQMKTGQTTGHSSTTGAGSEKSKSSSDHTRNSQSYQNPSAMGNKSPDSDTSHREKKKTVPPRWMTTDIKTPPTATKQEIWNNILSALEKLIVARQSRFAPLGAAHTSLTELPENKYKASGRCIIIEKNGNQIAYEFECIALVNKYQAGLLSVKFHQQN